MMESHRRYTESLAKKVMAAQTNTDLDVAIVHTLTFNTTISALSYHHPRGVSTKQWPHPSFTPALASSAAEATDTSIARLASDQ
ncbi:uncharacterized protein PAN0_011d4331 [Moesziomyces antarcticus]|uniref:Uncharacterized protein n=2 Tax=Pseudozyma antarctica TaxID=84753 RepID=A0A081CHG3_PSEA2|nr:uncharacterized protein PAN0_011d4331 [Moesziomyces antarcticus]GAK66109.1 hypothetical protein PAN0_011d4331 [Moesziomyces antarcticus]SPO46887.1 uncharacterized protein PSANT_04573 [Moesziomyces antarcticus]